MSTRVVAPSTSARVRAPGLPARTLAWVAAGAVFLQIALGGFVRASDSGLGCRDEWPLCNGHPYPGWDSHAIVEYSHRTLGVLVSLLVLATALAAWRSGRGRRLALAGLAALALEIPLGALVVFRQLSGALVLAHLALAETLLALMLALALLREPRPRLGGRLATVLAVAAGLCFLVILAGASLVATGADDHCHAWPLCAGGLSPDFSGVNALTMLHRGAAALLMVLLLPALLASLRAESTLSMRSAAAVTLLIALLQVTVGALATQSGDWTPITALHVGLASALWGGTVTCALLARRLPQAAGIGSNTYGVVSTPAEDTRPSVE